MVDNIESALYVVSTPIGNLADISSRALEVLGGVDAIAAEDTRVTRHLLTHFALNKPMISTHSHNEAARADAIVARILAGESVALVCDAGTPVVSDPGAKVVRAVVDAGCRVIPVPGASALLSALVVAHFDCANFIFDGFLPTRASARRQRLKTLNLAQCAIVLYEAPHRIMALLNDAREEFGAEREAIVARELTKRHECVYRGTLDSLIDQLTADAYGERGELVVVIEAAMAIGSDNEIAALELAQQLAEVLPAAKAAGIAARHYQVDRKKLYQALAH